MLLFSFLSKYLNFNKPETLHTYNYKPQKIIDWGWLIKDYNSVIGQDTFKQTLKDKFDILIKCAQIIFYMQ